MIQPQKEKYFQLYMDMAERVSEQSHAKRKQVGCTIVTTTGLVALGWNGMPSGYPNQCEISGVTNPLVIHAERNALDKMSREGVSPLGSIVFTTLSPCIECAKSLAAVGVSAVYYRDHHREEALEHLRTMGIHVEKWSN